jgi:hypothetical protein
MEEEEIQIVNYEILEKEIIQLYSIANYETFEKKLTFLLSTHLMNYQKIKDCLLQLFLTHHFTIVSSQRLPIDIHLKLVDFFTLMELYRMSLLNTSYKKIYYKSIFERFIKEKDHDLIKNIKRLYKMGYPLESLLPILYSDLIKNEYNTQREKLISFMLTNEIKKKRRTLDDIKMYITEDYIYQYWNRAALWHKLILLEYKNGKSWKDLEKFMTDQNINPSIRQLLQIQLSKSQS